MGFFHVVGSISHFWFSCKSNCSDVSASPFTMTTMESRVSPDTFNQSSTKEGLKLPYLHTIRLEGIAALQRRVPHLSDQDDLINNLPSYYPLRSKNGFISIYLFSMCFNPSGLNIDWKIIFSTLPASLRPSLSCLLNPLSPFTVIVACSADDQMGVPCLLHTVGASSSPNLIKINMPGVVSFSDTEAQEGRVP